MPPAPPAAEPIAYRPVSGFAVAGVALGGLFAVMVIVAAIFGLYQGAPFFYPSWIVVLPAAGLVLSLVARSRIRGSEGTQAGETVASWGIWLGLLFGLGYFVYFQVTGQAVTSQANAFFMDLGPDSGFFPHLQNATAKKTDLYAAFLLTLPATGRGNIRPEDEAGIIRAYETSGPDGTPGKLANFRDHVLVRFLTTPDPKDVRIEALGVQGWDYEDRSYKVRRLYRFTTPEAVLDMAMPAWSTEGESAGEPRRWWLPLPLIGRPSDKQIRRTPFGEGLSVIRFSMTNALFRWQQALNDGHSFREAADPAGQRTFADADTTPWASLPLAEPQRGQVQARLQDLFNAKDTRRVAMLTFLFAEEQGLGGWKITEDKKVQIAHGFRMPLDLPGKEDRFYVTGRIIMETKDAVDPVALGAAPREVECVFRSIAVTRAAPITARKS
jgi:hypothetical protein